ncbi:MAG: hypothetical protein K2H21_10740 [Muribaculaceae bacterium]|nr:hypothetical protein [Muribaculaceae bacterium]
MYGSNADFMAFDSFPSSTVQFFLKYKSYGFKKIYQLIYHLETTSDYQHTQFVQYTLNQAEKMMLYGIELALIWKTKYLTDSFGFHPIIEHFSEIALKEKDFYFEFERLDCSVNVY